MIDRLTVVSVALWMSAALVVGCGSEDAPGATLVTVENASQAVLRNIVLTAGDDTLKADTLRPGDTAGSRLELVPNVPMELTWVVANETRSIAPVLLDSVHRARELELHILAGELDLEINYQF